MFLYDTIANAFGKSKYTTGISAMILCSHFREERGSIKFRGLVDLYLLFKKTECWINSTDKTLFVLIYLLAVLVFLSDTLFSLSFYFFCHPSQVSNKISILWSTIDIGSIVCLFFQIGTILNCLNSP